MYAVMSPFTGTAGLTLGTCVLAYFIWICAAVRGEYSFQGKISIELLIRMYTLRIQLSINSVQRQRQRGCEQNSVFFNIFFSQIKRYLLTL